MFKKLITISSISLVLSAAVILSGNPKSADAGPVAGAACCAVSCAPGGGPISPVYWACTAACIGTAGVVNMFAPGLCTAAFVAPTP